MFLHKWLKRLLLVFPGRIALGKLGMCMVAIGQKIQRRYAGWNKEFRMKVFTFDTCSMAHFSISNTVTSDHTITFCSPNSQPNKQTDYVKLLFKIQGVTCVTLHPYKIEVGWGEVFSPEEIIPQVEKVLLQHFTA